MASLEGGYNLNFLGRMATTTIAEMAESKYEIRDKAPVANNSILRKAEQVIRDVKRMQSSFWNLELD